MKRTDSKPGKLRTAFALARERYAGLGVDVNRTLKILGTIPISLHCPLASPVDTNWCTQ